MAKVSYYLIEKPTLGQAELACRLCQQIYKKHRIWVFCKDATQCTTFDEQLWQYQHSSFIPHGIDLIEAPICLSNHPPRLGFDVCINLSGQAINVTELPHDDLHIIEIVGHNEQDKQLSREVFKQYRQLSLEQKIHKI